MLQPWKANLQERDETRWPFRLPDGRYEIQPATDAAIRKSSGASAARGDEAHPIFGFLGPLGGMGISIAEVCRICGASIENGPVLARTSIRYYRPIRTGRVYVVEGVIASVTRKPSRRFGIADHVVLELGLRDEGEVCATVSNTMIMPTGRAL